jgi:hypothetical protein
LTHLPGSVILIIMTRKVKPVSSAKIASGNASVNGCDEVIVIAARESLRLKGGRTGRELVAVMQAIPYPDVDLTPERGTMPVRDVQL